MNNFLRPALAACALLASTLSGVQAAGLSLSHAWTLSGKWISVDSYDGKPLTLEFSRKGVFYETYSGNFVKVVCEDIRDKGMRGEKDEFRIVLRWQSKVKRGNGRIIDRENANELLYHRQEINGRRIPILSEMVFEADGRGEIVFGEFVREEDLKTVGEKFRSALKQQRLNVKAPPMYKQG